MDRTPATSRSSRALWFAVDGGARTVGSVGRLRSCGERGGWIWRSRERAERSGGGAVTRPAPGRGRPVRRGRTSTVTRQGRRRRLCRWGRAVSARPTWPHGRRLSPARRAARRRRRRRSDFRRGGVGLGTPPAGRACRRPPWVRDTRGAWPLGGGARPAFGDGSGAGPATAGPDRPARARPGGCGAATPAGRRPARRHRPPSGRRRLGCREGSRCGGARAAFGNGSGAGPATAGPERIGRSCSGGCGAAAPAAGRLDPGRADTSCGAPAPAAGHAIGGRRAARPTAARRGASDRRSTRITTGRAPQGRPPQRLL